MPEENKITTTDNELINTFKTIKDKFKKHDEYED